MSDTVTAFLDECFSLDDLLDGLETPDWATPTRAVGWTIAHQIAHLAWTDEVALLAATDPDAFAGVVAAAERNVGGYVDEQADRGTAAAPAALLDRWRTGRNRLGEALQRLPHDVALPWFGPPMRARSMATARLMETWTHGEDVADALGVRRPPTSRLRDIAHLGVRTRDFAYVINGLPVPGDAFRIELTAPDGTLWVWGEEDADDRVSGPAEDFCRVVTQRLAPTESTLTATGEAQHWLTFAQAFAGPPKAAR